MHISLKTDVKGERKT